MQVPEVIASRVATYFVEGAKLTGLLNPDYSFSKRPSAVAQESEVEPLGDLEIANGDEVVPDRDPPPTGLFPVTTFGAYAVRIQGPGIDSMVEISGEDDLLIVQAMLKKIEKLLRERAESGRGSE